MKIIKLITVFVAFSILQGCEETGDEDSGTEVTTTLQNILDADRSLTRGFFSRGQFAANSDITIDSLQIPIFTVGLGVGDSLDETAIVYDCVGESETDCRVELVGDALENLLTEGNVQSIDPATYTSMTLSTCSTSGSYTAIIQASGKVNPNSSTIYYTQTGSDTLSTDVNDYGPVEVTYSGCSNSTILNEPVEVGEDPITLNLYIDLRDLAHIIDPTNDPIDTYTCTVGDDWNSATAPYVCMTYPNVSGSIGDTPTLERYLIQEDFSGSFLARANVIGIYFDGDGNPVGGYGRLYFDGETYYERPDDRRYEFKRAYTENSMFYITNFTSTVGETNFDTVSENGDKTIVDFPTNLEVGDAAVTRNVYDRDNVDTGDDVQITRIE